MRWRPESFGATVFVGVRFGCYLNHGGLKFIQGIELNKKFSVIDLMMRVEKNQENFLKGLVKQKVFLSSDSERKEVVCDGKNQRGS